MLKRFRKRDCKCSGHRRGRPKIGWGPCYGCALRPAVRERIDGERASSTWVGLIRAGWDPDDMDE
jgi:hypothetical protein